MSSIILLSGGLDSAVALALHIEEGNTPLFCLTYDYGQRAANREMNAARTLSQFYNLAHRVIELPWFSKMNAGGALLEKKSLLPNPKPSQLDNLVDSQQSAQAVWVPNRNGVFIEIAASLAEDQGACMVVTGFNREEAATFPDNSEAYLCALSSALSFSTATKVRVISPTAKFTKTEIVSMAKKLGFPFKLLWSCYENFQRMCGRCESCQRLRRALLSNEVNLDFAFENTNI